MKQQKAGNSEPSLQIFIWLVPCQPQIHIFSQEAAISLTSIEIVLDIFNKKIKLGN